MSVFALEKDVVSVLDDNLSSLFGEGHSVLEFACGHGRPDIVFTTTNNLVERQSVFDYDTLNFLSNFCERRGGIFHIDEVLENNYFSREKISRVISLLEESEFIKQKSFGCYKVTRKYEPPLKDFISIEVKMKDWKQGYYQAVRYSSFSTKSYLAISSEYIQNVDMNVLKNDGIGLISVSEITAKILLKAKTIEPKNVVTRYLSMERLYGRNV